MWLCSREIHIHLEKHAVLVHTRDQTFLGLFAVVFILVGHYPCYGSPSFSIVKSFSVVVFPSRFFQGYLPKNIGVHLCMIWFPDFDSIRFIELNISTMCFCFVSR
jgi:hypothetical protein